MYTKAWLMSLVVFGLAGMLSAETNGTFNLTFPRWAPSIQFGSLYGSKTELDGAGSFSVNRYFVEGAIGKMWRLDRMISASVGFGQDEYRFKGVAAQPWRRIDTYRAGLFARWGLNDEWKLFGGPSIRSYGERGVDLDDALTTAFFGGASYKFSERLTLGPGIVAVEQLRDHPRIFPIVLIKWHITDALSLGTGGGLAATAGPGLSLEYTITKQWKAGITGRYEKKRFLLDGEGVGPHGVGEDENFPIFGSLTYFIYPAGSIGAIIGYNFGGKLRVEDSDGGLLYETGYKPAPNIGIMMNFRF